MMLEVKELEIPGYEKVIEAKDAEVGLHSIIAVHNTTLGPSLGGIRIYPYENAEEALTDALRLSKGMTYKSAVAETGLGGGKSVIIADPKTAKTPELLHAFGKAIDELRGSYIGAEDVGTTVDDLLVISETTKYVAALPKQKSSGDPSPYTAWGCFRAIQAMAVRLWGSTDLVGKRVAIQGLGSVGYRLAEFLYWHGADLVVTDVNHAVCSQAATSFGANIVQPETVCEVSCDIFAPCAMGATLDDACIEKLKCQGVAGSANNQLAEDRHARALADRGILYAPDFVANAGGIINASIELDKGGYDPKRALQKVNLIYTSLLEIFEQAELTGLTTAEVANHLAEKKLESQIGKRLEEVRLRG